MYTLYAKSGIIKRDSDGKQVMPSMNPNNPNDQDLVEYYEWVRAGGVPKQDLRNPDAILIADAKSTRSLILEGLVVTTSSGRSYDGDLESQTRIATSIASMSSNELTPWVLSDDTVAQVSREELLEALRIMRKKTTSIWIIPSAEILAGGYYDSTKTQT